MAGAGTQTKTNETASFRKSLIDLRSRLKGDLVTLADGDNSQSNLAAVGSNFAEPATEGYDHDFLLGLVESEQETLDEIEAALVRLDAGTFGCCEGCSGPIAKARLQALPHTRFCITCARDREAKAR